MSNASSFIRLRLPLIIFLAGYLFFTFLTYRHYGITFDERDVYLRGKLLYTKVRGNDKVLQKDFVIPSSSNEMLYYDNTYPALLYQLNNKESFERYHLLNLIFASLVFVIAYELLLAETNKPLLSLMGPVFLLFTPRFFGDIPANPKDIPFAIVYFASLSCILLSGKISRSFRILLLGLLFGLAQAKRLAGFSLYPVYLLFLIYEGRKFSRILSDLMLISCLALLVHMIAIPYLGADPFNHSVDLIKLSVNHPWNQNVLLLGKTISAQHLPWYYIPVWFSFTLPLFMIPLFIVGMFFTKTKSNILRLFRISLILNILIIVMIRPVLYDGIRHLLYFIPQMVIIASYGLLHLMKNCKFRKWIIAAVTFNIVMVTLAYVKLHPYEYVYFNELAGGVKGAYAKFDLDYWGAANREAVLWLRNEIELRHREKVKVSVCGVSYSSVYYFSDKMHLTDDRDDAEYAICWDRFGEDKKIDGTVIHAISRYGVPLVKIFRINNEKKN